MKTEHQTPKCPLKTNMFLILTMKTAMTALQYSFVRDYQHTQHTPSGALLLPWVPLSLQTQLLHSTAGRKIQGRAHI